MGSGPEELLVAPARQEIWRPFSTGGLMAAAPATWGGHRHVRLRPEWSRWASSARVEYSAGAWPNPESVSSPEILLVRPDQIEAANRALADALRRYAPHAIDLGRRNVWRSTSTQSQAHSAVCRSTSPHPPTPAPTPAGTPTRPGARR